MNPCKLKNCPNAAMPGYQLCPVCLTSPETNEAFKKPIDPRDNPVDAFVDYILTGAGRFVVAVDPGYDSELMPAEFASNELAEKYPQYYKPVGNLKVIDVYTVHQLFNIQDPSGCIQHASKKLLLSGVRTGGKSTRKDIQEARDTLTRWLDLNPEQ